jgi:hypothetical protein
MSWWLASSTSLRAAALAITLGLSVAFTQSATLQGRISDQSGAIISGAKVTVTSPGGRNFSATSRTDGTYSIGGLSPGRYTIRATAPDLALRNPIELTIESGVRTQDLQLSIAVTSQQVAVQDTAATVTVDPSTNASATVLRGADLNALSDDPSDLAADLQALAGPGAGPNGGEVFVDGFSGGEIPSKDSIREVRLNQNPFAPEYDKLGLGRIEVFTKPGTDKFRGTLFHNFSDDVWNSRNPYAGEKAPFLLREYGGNVGGPINSRSSFFIDVRRDATDNGAIINGVTLDPATLTPQATTGVYRVEQRAARVGPRMDFQLDPKNTLTLSYRFTQMDVPGAGVGSFNQVSRGYDVLTKNQTAQISETALLGLTTVNEARFQYFRSAIADRPFSTDPAVQVLGSFFNGGAQVGRASDLQNSYEFQDYVSLARGKHTWRLGARLRGQTEIAISPLNFGGTFTFSGGIGPELDADHNPVLDATGQPVLIQVTSIEQYRRTLLFQNLGYSPARIRNLGGGASQFSIAAGNPLVAGGQADVGAFVGDDWRIRPNLTASLGLRYETQTNIGDRRDFAPRAAVAWAPAGRNKSGGKTVLRGGFGIFYDRFALTNTLAAERYNGIVQQQYIIPNPDTFPYIPSISAASAQTGSAIQEVSSRLRAPYILQSTLGIERQLPWNTKIAITYANSHGLHQLRSRDINAPIPGSFDPNAPEGGIFPYRTTSPIFLMESAGLYNQNQLILNVTTNATRNISLSGSYILNRALSNTDGVTTFPANQYDLTGEYGPAATDVRQRVSLNGTINTKWNFSLSPFVVIQSGPPFNLIVGQDLYDTTLLNARPAFATNPEKPGVIATAYGLLDPNPTPGEQIVPRNYGRGPGSVLLNLRVSKTIGFGKEANAGVQSANSGLRSIFSAAPAPRPYNLVISMAMRNIINHTNPGPVIGDIASPLFGQANQPSDARDLGGGGFSEAANNRRLELQVRFTF